MSFQQMPTPWTVSCPVQECHARVGEPCEDRAGRKLSPAARSHRQRRQIAFEAEPEPVEVEIE